LTPARATPSLGVGMIGVWIALASMLGLALPSFVSADIDTPIRSLRLVRYAANQQVPPFTATTTGGERVSLAELRGSVVVVTFWTTTCEPCRNELRMFEVLHREMGESGLVVVGIARESAPAIADYAREIGLTFRLVQDAQGDVSGVYNVMALPTTFVIAKDGRAVGRAVGTRDWTTDAARSLVRSLLAESGSRR
jgi:peroxiredoxin